MSTNEEKVLKREDELTDISQIPAVQQGLYAPDKPSLFGKFKEGVSGLTHKISHPMETISHSQENVHPDTHSNLFTKLNEGISSIATGIATTLHIGGHETQPLGEKVTQEVEGAKEEIKDLGSKMTKTIEEYRNSGDLTTETTITPNREGPSVLDKINEGYGKVAEKIADTVGISSNENQDNDTNTSQRGEGSEPSLASTEQTETLAKALEAPTHQVNPAELKEFHEVKTGFHESVDEFKHEARVHELGGQEELASSNPFDALGGAEEETTEEPSSKLRSIGEDISNKVTQTVEPEAKSIAQVVKEGLTETSATLSSTLGQVADKAIHTMQTPVDKENFRQFA